MPNVKNKNFLNDRKRQRGAVIDGIPIFPVKTPSQVISALKGDVNVSPVPSEINHFFEPPDFKLDFSDVRGQEYAKRALEITAAGGHNLLMIGAPGIRQDHACQTSSHHSAASAVEESLETSKIYSADLFGTKTRVSDRQNLLDFTCDPDDCN